MAKYKLLSGREFEVKPAGLDERGDELLAAVCDDKSAAGVKARRIFAAILAACCPPEVLAEAGIGDLLALQDALPAMVDAALGSSLTKPEPDSKNSGAPEAAGNGSGPDSKAQD